MPFGRVWQSIDADGDFVVVDEAVECFLVLIDADGTLVDTIEASKESE